MCIEIGTAGIQFWKVGSVVYVVLVSCGTRGRSRGMFPVYLTRVELSSLNQTASLNPAESPRSADPHMVTGVGYEAWLRQRFPHHLRSSFPAQNNG